MNPPPASEADKNWATYPLLGIGYVAASARRGGHEVRLLDGKLGGLSEQEIVERTVREDANLVGITCMTVEFPMAKRIADSLRARGCKASIVLGGAHVNAVGARALAECGTADFACVGEGELLICELADALERGSPVGDVCGLVHRVDSQIVTNAPREYYDDYDDLPFPAWDLFNVGEQIPVLTHRGCPFQCNFCGHNSGFKARYRTPENVLDEIGDVISVHAPSRIRFEDETFGLNIGRTKAILSGLVERGYSERTTFSAQTRVDRLDRELVQLLKRCNFELLELGVESGSDDVLARMGKGIRTAQVIEAVEIAKSEGLQVWCKFILGHPNETRAQMRETIRFIRRLNPDRLSVALMTPFPGTPIFDMAVRGEGGYRLLSDDWSNFDKYTSGVLELDDVPLYVLKRYQLLAYASLYVGNRRIPELLRLVRLHSRLAVELVTQFGASLMRRRPDKTMTPIDPGRNVELQPLSNVSMPDSTLVHLRTGNARRTNIDGSPGLRTWASPGPDERVSAG